MNISIVGIGLIGGSLALDLTSQINVKVSGVDTNADHCNIAMKRGIVQGILSLDDAINTSEVLVLSIPVDTLESLLPSLLDNIGSNTVVIDLGSTKAGICKAVRSHKNRGRYVSAHPLAGTEYSGPNAAIEGLFRGKKNIICNREQSDQDALDIALSLFRSVGLNTHFMDAKEHDKHMAYVSHLSHVTSFTLGLTVLDIEKDEKQIFNLASTGFASTVRLAKSNPHTWSSIFDKNSEHLVKALDSYITQLSDFRNAIADHNIDEMERLMKKANDIKRILQN